MSFPFRFLPAVLLISLSALAVGCRDSSTEPVVPAGEYALITTYAGTGFDGSKPEDGWPLLETDLSKPQDIAFGPDDKPYILDWNNHRVRVVTNGRVWDLIGTGELGDASAGAALETRLNHPTHVSIAPDGALYLAAWHNSVIMRMDLTTNYIEPVCGDGQRSFGGDGGPAEDALINLPVSTVWDSRGNVVFMDQANQRLRRVENGIINTIAGTGQAGFAGDDGPALAARFNFPVGQSAWPAGKIAIDKDDNIYIPDTGNHRIRKVHTDGTISTVGGNGERGFAGDGGPAVQAQLSYPGAVAVDADGNIYITDTFNHCIRKITAKSAAPGKGRSRIAHDEDAVITTFCGTCGQSGFTGDGGRPENALLNHPRGVSIDSDGNIYIADTGNNRIRIIRRNSP